LQNSTFEEMNKQGQVLVYGNYTPLLADRTTKHQVRRGYQRKKLAKRLLSVILIEYFDFSADKHTITINQNLTLLIHLFKS
jgi:hypothetical protein